jgi:hypothetical protein
MRKRGLVPTAPRDTLCTVERALAVDGGSRLTVTAEEILAAGLTVQQADDLLATRLPSGWVSRGRGSWTAPRWMYCWRRG